MTIDDFKNGQCSSSDVASLSTADIGFFLGEIKREGINPQNTDLQNENLQSYEELLIGQLVGRLRNTITVTPDKNGTEDIQINLEEATDLLKLLAEYTGTYQTMIDNEWEETLGTSNQQKTDKKDIELLIKGGVYGQGQNIKGLLGDGKDPYDILNQLVLINKIVKNVGNTGNNQLENILYNIKDDYVKKIIDLLCSDERFEYLPVLLTQTNNHGTISQKERFPYLMTISYEGLAYHIEVHISQDMIEYIKGKDKEYSDKKEREKQDGGIHHRFLHSDGNEVGTDKAGDLYITDVRSEHVGSIGEFLNSEEWKQYNQQNSVQSMEGFLPLRLMKPSHFYKNYNPKSQSNFRTEDLLTMRSEELIEYVRSGGNVEDFEFSFIKDLESVAEEQIKSLRNPYYFLNNRNVVKVIPDYGKTCCDVVREVLDEVFKDESKKSKKSKKRKALLALVPESYIKNYLNIQEIENEEEKKAEKEGDELEKRLREMRDGEIYDMISQIINNNAKKNKWTIDHFDKQLKKYLDSENVVDAQTDFIAKVKDNRSDYFTISGYNNPQSFDRISRRDLVFFKLVIMQEIKDIAVKEGVTIQDVQQALHSTTKPSQQHEDTENKQSSTDDDTDGITN